MNAIHYMEELRPILPIPYEEIPLAPDSVTSMLFSHMPLWLNAIIFVLCFMLKHYLTEKIEQQDWYQAQTAGRGWTGLLNAISALNGALTFVIFFFFIGMFWSCVLAGIDLACHWLAGYYKNKKRLPNITAEKFLTAAKLIRGFHATTYVGFIIYVLEFLGNMQAVS